MPASAVGREVPRLPGWPVLGSWHDVRRDFLGTVTRADRTFGGLARIVAGPPGWRLTVYLVTEPDLVEQVLTRPDVYRKQHPGYRELRRALGDNVLTSEDEAWHRQRRFLGSMFTRRRVETEYAPVMTTEAMNLVERWHPAAREGRVLDAYPEMIAVASTVSGRILFGADMSAARDLLSRFRRANDQMLRRAVSPHPLPPSVPTPGNRRMNGDLGEARTIVEEMIRRRRAASEGGAADMLGLLLSARDSEDAADRLSDREVADQAMLFLLAGHDTTSVGLTNALLLLARHPQWQHRLRDELDRVIGGRAPTAADLPRLPWLERVVRETLRLYPSAHGIGRTPLSDQVLGGHSIPAGAWVEVSIWGTHRSPRTWSDPDLFDPTRFDLGPDLLPGGHRYAYLPFGAGARACIGRIISFTEIQIILAALLQSFVVTAPHDRIDVHAAITLLPSGSTPIVVRPR